LQAPLDQRRQRRRRIHSALDEYNNTGAHCGVTYAQDGDNGTSSFELQYALISFSASHDWYLSI
jgi:hypothetical protein